MINRIDQKVREICDRVSELALPRYKEVIAEIYSSLIQNDVYLIVIESDCDQSILEWNNPDHMLQPLAIKLCVSNYKGKSVLWDLVHEFNHLLIFNFGKTVPKPEPWWLIEKRCARNKEEAQLRLDNEEAAWDAAQEWLNVRLSLTRDELGDFNCRRNSCLATYKGKVADFEKK